jgi:hypothetical protein
MPTVRYRTCPRVLVDSESPAHLFRRHEKREGQLQGTTLGHKTPKKIGTKGDIAPFGINLTTKPPVSFLCGTGLLNSRK